MRWQIEKKPELGDIRTSNKFILFPKKLKNLLTEEDVYIWLEKVCIHEVYDMWEVLDDPAFQSTYTIIGWKIKGFTDVKK